MTSSKGGFRRFFYESSWVFFLLGGRVKKLAHKRFPAGLENGTIIYE
jgi:hypothetical protein